MASGLFLVQCIFVQDALLVLFIATQPGSLTIRFAGLVAIISLALEASKGTTGVPTQDYFFGFWMASQTLVAVQMMLLRKPLDQLRHERDPIAIREMSFWRRMYWSLCLDHSWRAIGWTHQVNNVPTRPTVGRVRFIRTSALRVLVTFFLTDMANTFVLYQVRQSTSEETGGYYLKRAVTIWTWVYVTVGLATMQYLTLAILSVSLGVHLPSEWPDNFGKLSDAYTLRNFWGKVWHQNLRRLFTPVSAWILQVFRISKGTNASSYVQLYTAFILSGLVHSTGDAFVAWRFAGTSLPYFLSQALAITMEDMILALARRVGCKPSPWTYFVGYCWVFVWGAYSFSTYRDLSVKAGWDWLAEWSFSPSTKAWKHCQQYLKQA
ncbi:hypothetical protein VNI00_001197 [Paramarasmius palmivorus]|uniref:Wax synthase domain-containing protein n=1 Tax=Paramarasmius palmivorus TaxID=297713 RepID=A0AAW0E6Q1_9AGAR